MRKRSRTTRAKENKIRNEVSSGAIAFNIDGGKTIRVLVLVMKEKGNLDTLYKGDYLDMPKGHVERGEPLERAAHREIMEEIGVPLHLDTNFREEIHYVFDDTDWKTGKKVRISKTVTFFLAFLTKKDIRQIVLSPEHNKYYLLPIDEVIEKVKFENQRELLEKAKTYISANYLT